MKKLSLAAVVSALLLSGCQQGPRLVTPESAKYYPQASRPVLQMTQLWTEGGLNASTPLPVATIRADSDRVTFTWNGDAVELLSALARARGQTFSYVGIRLPLPIDIEIHGVTYANVLRMIEMQIAWRATVVTYPGQMVLQFMPSPPAIQAHHAKGSR